jgi:hypothetical protein
MRTIPRSIPRLMSPRLPVGRRWLRFCRSPFAGHIRASARGLQTTVVVLSSLVVMVVLMRAATVLQVALGGVA